MRKEYQKGVGKKLRGQQIKKFQPERSLSHPSFKSYYEICKISIFLDPVCLRANEFLETHGKMVATKEY